MKKAQKYTDIYFMEGSSTIDIFTYNAGLKRRLSRYAERHPDLCRMTDDDELGGQGFEIQKGRFCFRLTEPYSKERREAASRYAKEHHASDRLMDREYHDSDSPIAMRIALRSATMNLGSTDVIAFFALPTYNFVSLAVFINFCV